jgi:hypothetical protein
LVHQAETDPSGVLQFADFVVRSEIVDCDFYRRARCSCCARM